MDRDNQAPHGAFLDGLYSAYFGEYVVPSAESFVSSGRGTEGDVVDGSFAFPLAVGVAGVG